MSGRTSSKDMTMERNPNTNDEFSGYVAHFDNKGRLDKNFAGNGVWIPRNTSEGGVAFDTRVQRLLVVDNDNTVAALLNHEKVVPGDGSGDEGQLVNAELALLTSTGAEIGARIKLSGSKEDIALGLLLSREGRLVVGGMTRSTDGLFSGHTSSPDGLYERFIASIIP